jgi:predicted nucleotidyltransferase
VSVETPPTLEEVRAKREEILRVLASKGARNPRVFGSVARRDAVPESDVDLLVEFAEPRPRGWDYFGALDELQHELSGILGRPTHIVEVSRQTPAAKRMLDEAVVL